MNRRPSTLIITCLLLLSVKPSFGQRLGFALQGPRGEEIEIAASQETRFTVVCFLGTECPMARSYVKVLNALSGQSDDLRIVGVMSNYQDSVEEVANFVAELKPEFEIGLDGDARVADLFGASRTPEVFLLDEELKLRYHGRIDDQFAPGVARATARNTDLRNAIDELCAGKPVSIKETKALGCIIGRQRSAASGAAVEAGKQDGPTFAGSVGRILRENCLECHRDGEIGPFSMEEYQDVVGWADTMLEAIADRRMPPWHADPKIGSFANERLMSDSDIEILRAWVAAGAPPGDSERLTWEHASSAPERTLNGEPWHAAPRPDLILPMRERPFVVPKSGVVEYQYFVVDPQFTEDKWIKAAQVLPGSRDVVHHAIVFIRPPDGAQFQGVGWLAGYVPGQREVALPLGSARHVPAGSKFVFQMHYTPNGTRREDTTSIGLVFAEPEEVQQRVFTLLAIDQEFEIPPHADSHTVTSELSFLPSGSKLLAVTPHMHYRGKSFRLQATPEDREESDWPLLNVPRYDFNWQHTYRFREPIELDQLSALSFQAVFDNSAGNPFNPDPTQLVHWGDQTWEEMAVAFFEISLPVDESIRRRKRVASDEAERNQKVDSYVKLVFEQLDANQDGVIQESEGSIVVRHFNFFRWDSDRDGQATQTEVRQVAEFLFGS